MARAVVTGGAGFLGSHLSDRLLAEGYDVVAVDNLVTGSEDNIAHLRDNPRFEYVRQDIIQPYTVAGPVDMVYHFASPASPVDYLELPLETLLVGSVGTHHTLDMARDKGARFLMASTSEVYGDPAVHPQPEEYFGNVNPHGTRAVYDEAKRYAEAATFAYRRKFGMDAKIVRIFNTYGPYMHPGDGRVVSNFIVQALHGEDITIYGDGTQTRSFCYVDDLVDGIIRLMAAPAAVIGPINLGNPVEFTVRQLAEQVLAMTGSRSRIVFRDLPIDDPRQRRPDISRARELVGWTPEVDLKNGLRRTIDYFEDLLAVAVPESSHS